MNYLFKQTLDILEQETQELHDKVKYYADPPTTNLDPRDLLELLLRLATTQQKIVGSLMYLNDVSESHTRGRGKDNDD